MNEYATSLDSAADLIPHIENAETVFDRCALYGAITSIIDHVRQVTDEDAGGPYRTEVGGKLTSARHHAGAALGFHAVALPLDEHARHASEDLKCAADMLR